jgi:hypothetical protein
MTYMLNNLDEAVDRKFLVTKPMKAQAEPGSIIHVLDVKDRKKDGYLVEYRVTDVGKGYSFRDYAAKFNNVKDFCTWARPDNFIARHYEAFDLKEIQNYIKVTDRSFVTSGLPIIAVIVIALFALGLFVIKGIPGIIIAAVGSVIAFFGVSWFFRWQKSRVKLALYSKISSDWGVQFK